ncbi:MAG: DNA/RNA non-specific endonuclease [Bacteroidales bacterium]|nr:DNA/RNA non-specific endonuclease [Bacteroidales bacterium]
MMQKVAAAVAACCLLLLSSCEKPVGETMSVELRKTVVNSPAGQVFVSVKCSGTWTLSLAADNGAADWASLNVTSGEGDRNNIILTYQANTGNSSRQLRVILDNGSSWVECSLKQYSPDQDPDDDDSGNGSGSGSGSSGSTATAKTGWMELPAMDNDALDYYSHSFSMNGKTYRNYTFGWSQSDLVAHWVAYPLCSFYTNKTVSRTDAWAYDPLLGKYSSAPFGGYGGSYARGHQLPSADRLCCYEANAQTFYGTNMTPQLNAHNEGIWQQLESKVRNIAEKSDTTYVVTGVITKGSTKTTVDSDGKSMTVPTAYFKALLRYSKSSTLGQWNAAAFYLEHRSYSESIGKQHSMSIDELEKITGLDFFVNLPAKIGADQAAQLEAADPADSAMWW